MRIYLSLLLAGFAFPSYAAETVDLNKIARRVAKEPSYAAKEPLYGLAVFGPEAKTRVEERHASSE